MNQHHLITRSSAIMARYGWRTPIVVACLAWSQSGLFRQMRCWRLQLTTRGRKGSRIKIGSNICVTPGGWLEIGDGVFLEGDAKLVIGLALTGRVALAAGTWISRGFHLVCCRNIDIGENVLVGEYVSLRDSTHRYENRDLPISAQGDIYGSIRIEDGAWIGRGGFIQGKPEGTVIGKGAIVGANSVVVKSIPAMEIWGGVPARFIKKR